ncbi:acyl carrier protein [Catenovulum sp. SM1970]|uniref:acyl carrier protein n=1 Tax=Marinifaba aquimaris TaxID=2741323 RepID=UPI001573DDFE|nr:acyl carrier protein [Marinifaba aquimaris]NTS75295.1 acyl carrier protein [Marinifaba aquimaris]
MNDLNVEKIEAQLISIIASVKNLTSTDISLQPEDDFISQYGLSSMDAVSLSVKISQVFGFGFGQEVEDIDGLSSFGALTQLVQKRAA